MVQMKSLLLTETLSSLKLKSRLVAFYRARCPEKLTTTPDHVDKLVARFKDKPEKIEELFQRLHKRYDVKAKVTSSPSPKKQQNASETTNATSAKKRRFVPCASYDGSRSGYVFKRDHLGVGYYLDSVQKGGPQPLTSTAVSSSPPASAVTIRDDKKSPVRTRDKLNQRVTLDNGLEYAMMKRGEQGGPFVKRGSLVTMKYKGWLTSRDGGQGDMFDSGRFTFTVGRGEAIRGFDVGVMSMRQGDVRRLFVPSHLGYGARGSPPQIPRNADLLFEVELVRVGSRRGQLKREQASKRHRRGGGGGKSSRSRKRAKTRRRKGGRR